MFVVSEVSNASPGVRRTQMFVVSEASVFSFFGGSEGRMQTKNLNSEQ
jgi:hypothetical protein